MTSCKFELFLPPVLCFNCLCHTITTPLSPTCVTSFMSAPLQQMVFYLSAFLKDVAVAFVVVAGSARLAEHVRNIPRWLV